MTELTDAQISVLDISNLDLPTEIVLEYINDTGDDDLSDIAESYSGEFDSDRAFAMNMADNIGFTADEHWPGNCIDWEHAASELMYDYSVYVTKEYVRYYFLNM